MYRFLGLRISVCAVLVWASLSPSSLRAQQKWPHTIPYQGRLELNGKPFDGTTNLGFSLYTLASGGSALWTGTLGAVPVKAGRFSVVLGEQTGNAIPASAFERRVLYLEVRVDGVALAGRQRILAVPFASYADSPLPAGAIIPFGGSAEPPGWLSCDGRGLASADHPELFAAIGTRWGNGSSNCAGSCDFNLPDLRGRFVRGADAGAGRDPGPRGAENGGVASGVGSVQDSALKRHDHGVGGYAIVAAGDHTHTYTDPTTGGWRGLAHDGSGTTAEYANEGAAGVTSKTGNHTHQISGRSAKTGGSETRPINAAVLYIIKD